MQRFKDKTILLFFPGPMGGAEKVVAEGFRALKQLGLEVELWIVGETRAPQPLKDFKSLIDDLPFREFHCHSICDFGLIRELRTQLRKTKYSLIHAHGFKATFYAYLSKSCEKLIVTHHGKTAHTLKVRIYEAIEEFIMRRSQKVISVSLQMRHSLMLRKINSVTIENFLTFSTLPVNDTYSAPLKLLFVGRLSSEKGCNYLIEAMNLINDSDIHLTIVGDGLERLDLESKSHNQNIFFLGFRNDIAQLMSEHHALVMPSLREGMPLTLIEAICQGLPVIASKVGGIPELIQNNRNGILIPPEDVIELKNAILELKVMYPSFKNCALDFAPNYIQRFSSKTWATRTAEVYNSLSQP